MKKKKKPTKKQIRHEQSKRQQRQHRRSRQATLRHEDRLYREIQPLASHYNLEDEDEFIRFATDAMIGSGDFFEEPEFEGLEFDPADAYSTLLLMFNTYVPIPERFETLSEDERQEFIADASTYALSEFITPELQKDFLEALGQYRRRLRREGQHDKLAIASATELLLRNDTRPEIWATCGLLYRIYQETIDIATELEDRKASALELAQALQPDVEDIYDLEEGTPAYEAFWNAVRDDPELFDYVQNWQSMTLDLMDLSVQHDAELALELFDEEELDQFLDALPEGLEADGIPLEKLGDWLEADETRQQAVRARSLPELIRQQFSQERFDELVDDLHAIAEAEKGNPRLMQRARALHIDFCAEGPYWQNPAFIRFLFSALVDYTSEEEYDEEDDEDEA